MTDYSILFQFASRSRPTNFFRGLDSIVDNVNSDNYLVNVVIDWDDTSMNDVHILGRIKKSYPNVQLSIGRSTSKIDAINRLCQVKQDILVNMSDDMVFTTKGFDDVIRQGFTDYYPDLDGVLHFADPMQLENCMTMSIMGRRYFERDNFIYDTRCKSLWSDVIAQETAEIRGRKKYMGDHLLIFKHLHPSWGLSEMDAQYKQTEAWEVRQQDYDVYLQAKKEYDPENKFKVRPI